MARLLLYANEPVWCGVSEFFTLYWRASPSRTAAEFAKSQHGDDLGPRLEIADVGERMRHLQDTIVNHMRADVGTAAVFPVQPPRRRVPDAGPPPDPQAEGRS